MSDTGGGGTATSAELPAQPHHQGAAPQLPPPPHLPRPLRQPDRGNLRPLVTQVTQGPHARQEQVSNTSTGVCIPPPPPSDRKPVVAQVCQGPHAGQEQVSHQTLAQVLEYFIPPPHHTPTTPHQSQ